MVSENTMRPELDPEDREIEAAGRETAVQKKPAKEEKKGRGLHRLWPMAFFLALLALLFFLLRSFPISANSYAALKGRPGFMSAVRMELQPSNAYHIGVAEVDPVTGQAVAAMLLYEMEDGEALIMVDISILEEMMTSPEPIALRGVIAPLADEVKDGLPEVFRNFYNLSAEEGEARSQAVIYVDGRWKRISGQFLSMFAAAGVVVICFIMSLVTGRRVKDAKARDERR